MSEPELRVDRVILEVTWRPEKNLEPPAEWRWQDFVNLSGDTLGPGESVRVVEASAPKVKVPRPLPKPDGHDTYRSGWNECREEIIDAIRAEGVEVDSGNEA